MLETILIRRLIRRRLRRSRKYYFKWHDAMFFGMMKHEREKGKVTQNLPFYCLEISENSDYRSSLRTHPFLLRSIFSVNKAKIPSLRVSSLTIPAQCIDQSFLINEAKMHPSSTILHLPFIPRINRTPFHRSKNKNSTPYEKYPLYKISVYLFLFFFLLSTKRWYVQFPIGERCTIEGELLLLETDFKGIDIGYAALITRPRVDKQRRRNWGYPVGQFLDRDYTRVGHNLRTTSRQGFSSSRDAWVWSLVPRLWTGFEVVFDPIRHRQFPPPVFRGINVSIYWLLDSLKFIKCLMR